MDLLFFMHKCHSFSFFIDLPTWFLVKKNKALSNLPLIFIPLPSFLGLYMFYSSIGYILNLN